MNDILNQLANVLEQRKTAKTDESYVASLHGKGLNKILEKVSEEATETVLAAKDCDLNDPDSKQEVIKETADLWFHTMVMLSHLDLDPNQVLEELEKRIKLSGLEEKASRQN